MFLLKNTNNSTFYENLFADSDEYVIPGLREGTVMYVNDGRALCIAGVGKIDSAVIRAMDNGEL